MEHSGEEDINATNSMMTIANSTWKTKEVKRDSPAKATLEPKVIKAIMEKSMDRTHDNPLYHP